ncbi:hypothetical protein BH09SUM1_BH09SUM1_33380 [soil metagenome]
MSATPVPLRKRSVGGRYPVLLITSVLLFITLTRDLLFIAQGQDFIVRNLTIDDTYYYLQTAWNQKTFGFTTFDGVNPTNGVQFLWYWMLAGLGLLFSSKYSFLAGAMVLASALSATSLLIAGLIARRQGSGFSKIIYLLPIFFLLNDGRLMMMGLENAIHLPVFLLGVWAFLRFSQSIRTRRRRRDAPGRFIFLTFVWTLNGMVRMDAGMISAVVVFAAAVMLLYRRGNSRTRKRRALTISFLIAAAGAVIVLIGNKLMGGSYSPVSGMWKQLSDDKQPALSVFLDAWSRALPHCIPIGGFDPEWLVTLLGAIFLPVTAAFALVQHRRHNSAWRSYIRVIVVLSAACLIHTTLFVLLLGDDTERGVWYQTPLIATTALAIPLFLKCVSFIPPIRRIVEGRPFLRPILLVGITSLLAWSVIDSNFDFIREKTTGKANEQATLFATRVALARRLSVSLPPNARLAAWNAGQMGFFSERQTTNLDGLINSYDFFKYRRAKGSITRYLQKQHIDYVVDYQIRDAVLATGTIVEKVPIPKKDEDEFLVLKLSPELAPADSAP